jgi:outer membrane protein TolC
MPIALVLSVAVRYYSVKAAQEKVTTAKELAAKGEEFLKLTQNLEHGGEIAHSDVIKAQLQMLDRKRQVQEAQLGLLNARLDLSVIIFADFNDNFEVVDELHATPPMPALSSVQRLSMQQNPEINAALALVRAEKYDVLAARAGYLPPLTLDLFYGIDASHFALNSVSDGQKFSNLGYSGQATMNIPIWNWGTTQSRVKQAQLQQSQAKRELSLAERKLLADIESRYAEAAVALKDHGELNRSLELARDSLRLTTLRYKNAEAKVLEVVDAETALSSAASAYQDGAVRYHAAVANLQALTSLPSSP